MTDNFDVVVFLTSSAALFLADETSPIARALRSAGVSFTESSLPVHGPVPGRYLSTQVEGRQKAESLAHQLNKIDGVDTVYVKPIGEAPF